MSESQNGIMSENEDGVVLCAASVYEQKYYFNKQFSALPEDVQKELHIIAVLFTEEVGGEFIVMFDEEGNLEFRTQAKDSDYNYDEIGAALMVKEIRRSKEQLLASLEMFYKVVVLGVPLEDA